MLAAKQRGGANQEPPSTISRIDSSINDKELIQAIASGKAFRVVLQPQYDLLSGTLVGAEALARWNHQRFGEIAPSMFMPALTRMGGEPVLFEQVITQILDVLRVLMAVDAACPISVNTSVTTLSIPGLLRRLDSTLTASQVPPRLMKIEITEDLAIDDLRSLAKELHWIRAQGIGISMDDFGTGTSTLERLIELPFNELKIDRSFVHRMLHEPAASAVVRAALSLGNALGMQVVAEGVENAEQIRLLREFGVRVGQGYGLRAPMEVDAFIAYAQADTAKHYHGLVHWPK
ncbi:EAL domain-containing protein [Pseudomonas protegens]|uniref:EAL domain-containing protein n=1 Tax=Pseudomonas protegens TaxID=380021 RepID=UPI003800E7D2